MDLDCSKRMYTIVDHQLKGIFNGNMMIEPVDGTGYSTICSDQPTWSLEVSTKISNVQDDFDSCLCLRIPFADMNLRLKTTHINQGKHWGRTHTHTHSALANTK